VFDEAHVEFKNICRINSFSNVLYTIYLTATPNRSQFLENKLYEKVFKNVPYFDGRTLAPERYHNVLLV
jgi:superfamily II DNA or RNA helicase